MKKILILIIPIFLILISFTFADTDYYWYRTSESGATITIFTPPSDDSPNGNNMTIPGDWVLFSVEGDIKLTGSSKVLGKTGTNAFQKIGEMPPVILEGDTIIDVNLLYLGPGSNSKEVVSIPSWWTYGNASQTAFYDSWNKDTIKELDNFKSFTDPAVDFPLTDAHFVIPAIPLRESTQTAWDNDNIHISENGKYESITVSSNYKLTLEIGNQDLVLDIGNFNISQGQVIIERTGTGRLFVYADQFTLGGSSIFGSSGQEDFVFLFYKGDSTLSLAGSTKFYGSIFIQNSDISISGSANFDRVVSKGGIASFSGASISAKQIYAKTSDVYITGGAIIDNGVVTGGNRVDLTGGVEPLKYIYAPKADTTLTGSTSVNGTVICKTALLEGDTLIQGPPVTEFPIPSIPIPVIIQQQEDTLYELILSNPTPEMGTLSGSGFYALGQIVEITATANDGYEFVNWTDENGNIISNESIYTFFMPGNNLTLIAVFQKSFSAGDCSAQSDWLMTLCLNTSGFSYGTHTFLPENVTEYNFDDEKFYAYDNRDFDISFTMEGDKLRANFLWGNTSWTWDLWYEKNKTQYNNRPEFDAIFKNGANLRAVKIFVNDYVGSITVYNNSFVGIKVDIVEQNGHVNGNQITSGDANILYYTGKLWKSKKLK